MNVQSCRPSELEKGDFVPNVGTVRSVTKSPSGIVFVIYDTQEMPYQSNQIIYREKRNRTLSSMPLRYRDKPMSDKGIPLE